jgi:PAS domain S-box-containing protein
MAADSAALAIARLCLMAASGLASIASAFGLLFAAPIGAINGLGVWLVAASLVFSIGALLVLIVWPLDRLGPVAITITAFFAAYLISLGVYSVFDPTSRYTLFVGLIWFIPLQAFNRILNRGRAASVMTWVLLAAPLLMLALLWPRILRIFPPQLVPIFIVFGLAHITSTFLLNVLWRYREAFVGGRELSSSFRFAAEILESISESFLLIDRSLRVLYLNPSACAALGVERPDAEGKPLAEAVARFASPALDKALRDAWADIGPRQFHAESEGRWYEVRCTPGQADMSVYFQDITADRETRQALRAGELRLAEQAELLDKAHDSIMVRDLGGRILFWNQSAARLFGLASAEVVGRPMHEVLRIDRALMEEATARVVRSGEWRRVVKLTATDGRSLVIDSHLSLIRDEYGHAKSILAIDTDITASVVIEERLRQSERLEAVGQLTGGVAHDFNNLLTIILGAAETMIEDLADNEDLRALAEVTRRAADRGAALTRSLLAFSQRLPLEPRSVDVNRLLSEMSSLLRRALREDISLSVCGTVGVWPALVDPAQLESALLNLCLNARDAMPNGGPLTIETSNTTLDQGYADDHADVEPGDYAVITVSDAGSGIAPEHVRRVFDPFFTTKPFGKGTGLGLSMVYGFIKQSRGHVAIYSELGRGTSVKLFLPRAPGAPEVGDEGPMDMESLRGSETILVVEDDELVRRNVDRQLTGLGYRVITTANGLEALEAMRAGPAIDLLFTDVVMPGGLGGPALARAARELKAALRVLYTSGYAENAVVHHGRLDPGAPMLNKPYARADLARKVRAVLEAPL